MSSPSAWHWASQKNLSAKYCLVVMWFQKESAALRFHSKQIRACLTVTFDVVLVMRFQYLKTRLVQSLLQVFNYL